MHREMPRAMQADLLGRLGVALASGIDLRRAWKMETARATRAWRPRLEQVGRALAAGDPLAEALGSAGDTFPPIVRGMVAVGDRTGHQAESLAEVARMLHHGVRTARALRQSLAGPIFQLSVAIAVVGFLIFMAGMMQHDILRIGLRGTRGLVTLLAWLAAAFLGGRILCGLALASWRRHGIVRPVVDYLPVIGSACRAAEAAGWCRAASLASAAGLDAGRLLSLASSVAPGLAVDVGAVEDRLRGGATLAEALDRTKRFPLEVLEVVAVGEATGNTAEVLDRLAGHLDDRAREGFTAAARGAGFLVWAAVAALIALVVLRIFSSYLGAIQDAAKGL